MTDPTPENLREAADAIDLVLKHLKTTGAPVSLEAVARNCRRLANFIEDASDHSTACTTAGVDEAIDAFREAMWCGTGMAWMGIPVNRAPCNRDPSLAERLLRKCTDNDHHA